MYLQGSTLFAVTFDLDRLVVSGALVPILEDVASTGAAGGDFAISKPGAFLYRSGQATGIGWFIHWLDRSGKTQPLYAPRAVYGTLHFSPDGKRLAFSLGGADLWVKDLNRDTPSRLTFLPGANNYPVWTPDGRSIVFRSTNPSAPGIYWIPSDGSGEAQRLTDGKLDAFPSSLS